MNNQYIDKPTLGAIAILIGVIMLIFIISPIFVHLALTVIAVGLIKYGMTLRGVTFMQIAMKTFTRGFKI